MQTHKERKIYTSTDDRERKKKKVRERFLLFYFLFQNF